VVHFNETRELHAAEGFEVQVGDREIEAFGAPKPVPSVRRVGSFHGGVPFGLKAAGD
jgi:hypothetical protein